MSTTSRGPSRRTLVKGAAWSVPVVAVSSAAPAAAASQYVRFNNLGLACKLPGNSCNPPYSKGYLITTEICTNVRGTVSIDFGTASGTLCGETKTWAITPDPLVIDGSSAGAERCQIVSFSVSGEPDSANCPIAGSVTYTWTSSNGLSGTGTADFSAPATPPCVDCAQPVPGSTPDALETEQASAEDTARVTEPTTTVEDTAKTESTTPVAPSTDAGTTDEASTTAQP